MASPDSSGTPVRPRASALRRSTADSGTNAQQDRNDLLQKYKSKAINN